MTVAITPLSLRLAIMCCANIRSAFFPFFRREAVAESLRELHAGAAVVLRKRRIRDHPVEFLDISVFYKLWRLERVLKRDLRVIDIVEEHVHLADRPRGRIAVLAV